MRELPALPDPGWSSIEKAFYCRAQAINLLEEAELAESLTQAEDLAGVALRWLALARFHEAESTRTRVSEEMLRASGRALQSDHAKVRDSGSPPRRHNTAKD